MIILARRAPRITDDPPTRRWTEIYAVAFVLTGITFLNLRKNPGDWIKARAVPEMLYGLSADAWFNLAYLALAGAIVWLVISHLRRPLAFVPVSWLGKGQLLYLVFLWWMVVGNFERAVVSFAPQRLVTEGVIYLNAVICTLIVLLDAGHKNAPSPQSATTLGPLIKRTVAIGLAGMILSVFADWATVRALYGDRFAGYAGKHIRFGPDATAVNRPPTPGEPHP
jgi:hypothetical protein